MDALELAARTSWGLCADPGDKLAYALCAVEGPRGAIERLRSRDSPRKIALALSAVTDIDEAPGAHIAAWRARDSLERTEQSLATQREKGVRVLSETDPHWPGGLSDLGEHQPLSLWVVGDPAVLRVPRGWVGVVGSRRASPAGVSATRALLGDEVLGGRGVISGGARGIDSAAHHTALEQGIPTVAVLAGGLDRLYPPENVGMFARIAGIGALVAEVPCGVRALPERFLDRNRLIAAIASVLVVVEAAHRSGALNTAHHAATLGREVAVVPGRWSDPLSAGCWRLVREQSAIVLSEPEDLALLGDGAPGLAARG